MNSMESFIKNEDWENLSRNYSSKTLAKNLTFVDAMLLSKKILEDDRWDDNLQTFAIELIKSIKETYPEEWAGDWRYDAYLGYAYDLRGWDYEEKFETYKMAANKSIKPDPEVLMRLAMLWSYPGVYGSRMDEKCAIELLESSMKKVPYIEGVSCLVDLCAEIGDAEKEAFWKKKLEECEQQGRYAPYAFLDFFKEYD